MEYRRVQFPDAKPAFVVAIDICSSSEIIEDLSVRQSVPRYLSLQEKVKHFIADTQKGLTDLGHDLDPYKFSGDGWILLFSEQTPGANLLQFMRGLSELYRREVKQLVESLDNPPSSTGINFGVDRAPIFRATMFGNYEYVGRPITVACRLQGAIKSLEENPAYKALVSRDAFSSMSAAVDGSTVSDEQVKLQGVNRGHPLRCKRITLLQPSLASVLEAGDRTLVERNAETQLAQFRGDRLDDQSEKVLLALADSEDYKEQIVAKLGLSKGRGDYYISVLEQRGFIVHGSIGPSGNRYLATEQGLEYLVGHNLL